MRALTVRPREPGSALVQDVPEPTEADGSVLVETLAVGVCGTDLEIVAGEYGEAPPGEEVLVLGHESLGRVLDAPEDSRFVAGDLVVGVVRHPDPVPCANCAVGEWDMCRNGLFTEHGIAGLHGFARERYRSAPEFVVRLAPSLESVGVLLEPMTVVAKAWEHIERIGQRAAWFPERVLVTGAGPIGLLAALLGVQRGLDVHVLDRMETGPKPELVADLGATYSTDIEALTDDADIVLECTGVPELIVDVMTRNAHNAVVCLTGVSSRGRSLAVDMGGVNRDMVLQNDVVFGSVNANRRHYELGAQALADTDIAWLERLITRRVALEDALDGLERREEDVKVVLDLSSP